MYEVYMDTDLDMQICKYKHKYLLLLMFYW